MRHTVRNSVIVIVALLLSIWASLPSSVVPPGLRIGKLSLGKDLAGGVSLTYAVAIKPGDPSDTLSRVIEVLKERVDPTGQMEISMVPQGADRIEITMPLPTSDVKKLKDAFDHAVSEVSKDFISSDDLQRVMQAPAEQREARAAELAKSDPARKELIQKAIASYDTMTAARAKFDAEQKKVDAFEAQLKAIEAQPIEVQDQTLLAAVRQSVEASKSELVKLAGEVAPLLIAYEGARDAVLSSAIPPREIRAAVQKSNQGTRLRDPATGKSVELPSPRSTSIQKLRDEHPGASAGIDKVLAAWSAYEKQRQTLDDPSDLVRLLRGAGVLNFRIAVKPGQLPDEQTLRLNVQKLGPRNAGTDQAKWYKINKIESWYDKVDQLEYLKRDPRAFFADRTFVVEPYDGEYYMLCLDTPGSRLTENEGAWRLAKANAGVDQLGRPAIDFEMDPPGTQKMGALTEANVGNNMAVVLDDEVYTAPVLRDRISSRGQISGTFSNAELNYIIRVLAAGSLQAKLSPEPISQMIVGPSLGADNLKSGLFTGLVAFLLVSGFMIAYYFGSGVIAVVATVYNFILVLGVMSLNQAAFTVPGIAGIILTFGQAVDSNVLIYERMREEFHRGADMKTAVRLGFSRALAPIVDGNISNLIICGVLYYFGTPEIRGFAVTLGIGVLATLFSALVVSRLMFTVLMDRFGWKKTSQLPMAVPAVQRLMSPHVDWMKHRHLLFGGLVVFLIASAVLTVYEWRNLLGTEFVGGTQVELRLSDPVTHQPVTRTRAQIKEKVEKMASAGLDASLLKEAEVVPIKPQADGVTADGFRLKFGHTNEALLQDSLRREFADVMDTLPPLRFAGADAEKVKGAPVHPILSPNLGEAIGKPEVTDDVGVYVGGAAILLENLDPRPTKASLASRLEEMRRQPQYTNALLRNSELRVLQGSDSEVQTAVVLVRDPNATSLGDLERWERDLAAQEWRMVQEAVGSSSTSISVQSFSPAIARTFAAQGIVSTILSLLMLTIYVFARFGAFRWAVAATVPLFADVIGIIGLLAVAQYLYETPATSGFAKSVGLLPFKLDLAQIAAMLTIVGYSLNDKIIILDRIRENKGKLPFASAKMINDSINQTLSRTVITAGAHMITTIVLYLYGGEAVRGFAYTFNLGVLLGTYTSIVSTPLVWSRAAELGLVPQGAGGASAGGRPSSNGTAASAAAATGSAGA